MENVDFSVITPTNAYVQLPLVVGCKSFSIENTSNSILRICREENMASADTNKKYMSINSNFGQVIEGSPSNYAIRLETAGGNVQLKYNF